MQRADIIISLRTSWNWEYEEGCRLVRLFIQEYNELNELSRTNPVSKANGIYQVTSYNLQGAGSQFHEARWFIIMNFYIIILFYKNLIDRI